MSSGLNTYDKESLGFRFMCGVLCFFGVTPAAAEPKRGRRQERRQRREPLDVQACRVESRKLNSKQSKTHQEAEQR